MIKREDINGDTPLSVIVKFLEQSIEDKASRVRLDEFEQGVQVGQIKLLDMLNSLVGKKK